MCLYRLNLTSRHCFVLTVSYELCFGTCSHMFLKNKATKCTFLNDHVLNSIVVKPFKLKFAKRILMSVRLSFRIQFCGKDRNTLL